MTSGELSLYFSEILGIVIGVRAALWKSFPDKSKDNDFGGVVFGRLAGLNADVERLEQALVTVERGDCQDSNSRDLKLVTGTYRSLL
ncbi:hypothetical protein RvY_05926 [Ramazzottius varieornatus]|uniref:Uncharacterized protein n=1 Tax=Ramazzottius varieornatus TaxID=947166 RepID=A0A1D1UWU0_RAMVA|nr:hypothetical protein RvY_05926 [Ramazzottius varieornatus]